MKTATIKAKYSTNTSFGKPIDCMEITGKVIKVKIGDSLHTFLAHDGFLSHYASGKKVGVLPLPAQLKHPEETLQIAAEEVVHELIVKHGIDRVLVTLLSTEVLNKEPGK